MLNCISAGSVWRPGTSVPAFAALLLASAAPVAALEAPQDAVPVAEPVFPAVAAPGAATPAPAETPAMPVTPAPVENVPASAPVDPAAPATPIDPQAGTAVAPAPVLAEPAAVAAGEEEIVVSARLESREDPLAKFNAKAYEAIQAVDNAIVGPVAKGYENAAPKPLRQGLRNFLRNLEEPVSFVNYLLQLKPGRAIKSFGRFALNSTLGVAGLVDVAKRKPFHLPYRPNGFANTFACYGIGPGPYFFLPLVGPITLRDLVGLTIDKAAVPLAVGAPLNTPYYAIPAGVIDSLNDRIEIDGQLTRLREESPDPYVATRELYLKQRRAEIAAICPKKSDVPIDPDLPPRVGKGED